MSLRPSSDTPWGILVVEDDLATLRPMLELLRTTGYSAAGALNFDTASSLVRAIPFGATYVRIGTAIFGARDVGTSD